MSKSPFFPGFTIRWDFPKAPDGWLLRDGRAVSRARFPALFALYGTRFGKGNGRTTFNLPDDRAYFPRGAVGVPDRTFATTAVDTTLDVITLADHRFNRSGFPVRFSSSSGLPAGLSAATTYFVIWLTESTFKVASTEANALAGTAIDLTTQGSGTHTVVQYADPDASTRTAQGAGGSTGDAAGTVQWDDYTAHAHTVPARATVTSGSTVGLFGGTIDGPVQTNLSTTTMPSSGGLETRPKNISTYWIVKT